MYAVEVGHWLLPQEQANQLREYLLRGGFLMVDDFHGSEAVSRLRDAGSMLNEWETFVSSMSSASFPTGPIEDIPNSDPIFHTLYDLNDRFQVPAGRAVLRIRHHLRERSVRQGPALALHP